MNVIRELIKVYREADNPNEVKAMLGLAAAIIAVILEAVYRHNL